MISDKAVLMRFSVGIPGEERQDPRVTKEVKADKNLGQDSGKWEKRLYPKEALAAVKSKIGEARDYHNTVTLPFDNGIGILPAVLIMEYRERMQQFRGEIELLYQTLFLDRCEEWIAWAKSEHNGTFDAGNYPGCVKRVDGTIDFDPAAFKDRMKKKFYLRTEPLPVPNASHFEQTVSSLLGTDMASVDMRVRDAEIEGQREVLKRLMTPVKHMADTLAKDKPKIYATLIGNIVDICKVAPALNLSGDAELDKLIKDVEGLTRYGTDTLKESEVERSEARKAAEEMVRKLSGYKLA